MVSKRTSIKESLAAGLVETIDKVPMERTRFRALKVGNPNYFGNLLDSPFQPVVEITNNTTYELIKSVGFHPQLNRLDAVVFLNQSYGYGGDVCTAGSQEHVRFYLSFDGGAHWVDQGMASFTAYDVPPGVTGGRRLECAASVRATPPRTWCTIPNLIRARAILSWRDEPPANTPDHVPVWGNVHDTLIQVDPTLFLKWVDFFQLAEIKLTPELLGTIDLEQEVAASKATLGVVELKKLYEGGDVPPHRFALAEVTKLMKATDANFEASHPFYTISPKEWGFELSDVIGKLLSGDGNQDFEALDCVGLRASFDRHELVAVFLVKRASGFSGGPCTEGSREFVTFWGDFDGDGSFETCLGTASVQVFDLPVPDGEEIEYSVSLPVNLNPYLRPCKEGPRVVPIRAILSWNEAPDCADPDWVPPWGGREDTHVLIPPGDPVAPGDFSPVIHQVSNVSICAINQANGRKDGVNPFGGRLCITGAIPGAAYLGGVDLEYRLWATRGTTDRVTIVTPFKVGVMRQTGPATWTEWVEPQSASADGWFRYLEYGPMTQMVHDPERLLGYWDTGALTGEWTIHVEARRISSPLTVYSAATIICSDGTPRNSVIVSLDQEPPVADITITGYWVGGVEHPAIACGDFTKGVTIEGTYRVTDNLGVGPFSLVLEPNLDPPLSPVPVTLLPDPSITPREASGTWRVETVDLPPCGYVVRLVAYDQTIANCTGAWSDVDTVGFCLRAAP